MRFRFGAPGLGGAKEKQQLRLPSSLAVKTKRFAFAEQASRTIARRPYPGSDLGYEAWLARYFPNVASKPLGLRHHRLWQWFAGLEKSESFLPPPPECEAWPRGGAKSSTAELGVTYVGHGLKRHYVLYVSETQDKADRHVQSVAQYLEDLRVERSVGIYGNSKGWRRNQLRTSHGFNVEAIGLDTAARGIKLEEFRPDLIVFDDIDGLEDSEKTTAKNGRSISKSIIPAGSPDCVYLCVQNLIHEDSNMSQLVDGRADFLHGRRCFVEPAVIGLEYERYTCEDGSSKYRITAGEATWEGQDLEICEYQINTWGLSSFLQEAQHDVESGRGYFFDEKQLHIVDEIPRLLRVCRAWDFAGTQGGGDYTVGVLIGISPNGMIWILDVVRAQLSNDNVDELVRLVTEWDRATYPGIYTVRTPQDPGSAGKKVAEQDARKLGAKTEVVQKKKASRAKKLASKINSGNARLRRDGGSRTPELDAFLERVTKKTPLEGKTRHWNQPFISEARKFKEDETHEFDDQIDAGSDAVKEIDKAPEKASGTGHKPLAKRTGAYQPR